jgi:hypothetical protein
VERSVRFEQIATSRLHHTKLPFFFQRRQQRHADVDGDHEFMERLVC